ncbi:protein FAM98A-like [Oppia nitens]|uniref:protein FAM98A-like n=1 Tax=Oppia nitens TaxID=1686743 RepID=UPI0023DBC836|nr:protein FAM98A-like [Oppia nitens]
MTTSLLTNEILDSLQDLDYHDFDDVLLSDGDNDSHVVDVLSQLTTFSSIVSWISNQLQKLLRLESLVHPIKDDKELDALKIELNSLFRELNSPLIDLPLTQTDNRLIILNSLLGHLLASRMTLVDNKMANNNANNSMTITMNESQTARDLRSMLVTLGMGKPPENIGTDMLFKKIKEKLTQRIKQQQLVIEDSLLLSDGLLLSGIQWKTLEAIDGQLKGDYSMRREMLLRRCDCTVKSFMWKKSDNNNADSEVLESRIKEVYEKQRNQLSSHPNVTLANALAARPSDCQLLINGVVSNKPTNCLIKVPQTKGMANKGLEQQKQMEEIHKFRIGLVPDRGGRPNEQIAPSKESFSQQQQQRDNPQRGRGGHRGGGGGGRGTGYGNQGVSSGSGVRPAIPQNTSRIQGSGWTQNTGDRYSSKSNYQYQQQHEYYDNGRQQHQQPRHQQNNDNYYQTSGQQYDQQQQQYGGYHQQQQYGSQRQSQYGSQQQYSDGHSYNNNNNSNNYNNQQRSGGGGGGYRGGGGGGRRY